MLVTQTYLIFDLHHIWKDKQPIVSSFECQQVVTSKFCPTTECFNSSDSWIKSWKHISLLYKFDIRIKSAETSVCFPEFTYNRNCRNEIITVLLFCDLSCKVQGRDDLTCCCSLFLYIKDNSREGSCSCCFSKQACGWVTWFAQRYTYRDYVQGKF